MHMRPVIQRIGIAAVLIGIVLLNAVGTDEINAQEIDGAFAPAVMPGSVPQGVVSASAEPSGPAKSTLRRLDLAVMHLDYLFLDEVVAGRGGVMTPEVEMAIALVDYLLLPEVAVSAS
ncbi:MAG TPA: hypothetical protein VFV93_19055 [Thermomicrobiales bacterium]|nr:hypothetical protein [Thermomicrobiales bacterium]